MVGSLASVFYLFGGGCPPAIAGRIPFVIIDTVKGPVSRAIAHIDQKFFKTFPFLTYCNSSSTVVSIVDMFFIFASSKHTHPRSVCATLSVTFRRVPMLCIVALKKKAAARTRVVEPQISVSDTQLSSASTLAKPIDLAFIPVGNMECCQAVKLSACDVNRMGHLSVLEVR